MFPPSLLLVFPEASLCLFREGWSGSSTGPEMESQTTVQQQTISQESVLMSREERQYHLRQPGGPLAPPVTRPSSSPS